MLLCLVILSERHLKLGGCEQNPRLLKPFCGSTFVAVALMTSSFGVRNQLARTSSILFVQVAK